MATPAKTPKTKPAVKNPRKKLTLAAQMAKVEEKQAKLTAQASRLAVLDLKDFVSNLKVANVGSVFSVVAAQRPGTKNIDILQTLAAIGDLKVTIIEKPKTVRKTKAASAAVAPN